MAWCPNCEEDRPISRQTYKSMFGCEICRGGGSLFGHKPWCRGATTDNQGGTFDVCTFCHTSVFAKVRDAESYAAAAGLEATETVKANESFQTLGIFLAVVAVIAVGVLILINSTRT